MSVNKGEKRLVVKGFPAKSGGRSGEFDIPAGEYVTVVKVKANQVTFVGPDNFRYDVNRGTFAASTQPSGG